MLDQGIGLAYVDSARAAPRTKMTVDLRGKPRAAHIVKKPIYKREE
jgi:glycine cleavage system aminomethyltransferase T